MARRHQVGLFLLPFFGSEGNQPKPHFGLRFQGKYQEFKSRWRKRKTCITHSGVASSVVCIKVYCVNPSEDDRLSAIAKSLDQVIRWQAELDARIRELE